jgi:hypothetical protein
MKILLITSVLILLSTQASAQESFSSLEEQMTGKEFISAGLQKLSEEELSALNAWLQAHSVATLDSAKPTTANTRGFDGDTRGFEDDVRGGMNDDTIVSRIIGPVNGWDGETVFKLDNGMIWQQVESGRFHISVVENPLVTIDKGLFDSWRLKIDGYNKEVRVKRIQ